MSEQKPAQQAPQKPSMNDDLNNSPEHACVKAWGLYDTANNEVTWFD